MADVSAKSEEVYFQSAVVHRQACDRSFMHSTHAKWLATAASGQSLQHAQVREAAEHAKLIAELKAIRADITTAQHACDAIKMEKNECSARSAVFTNEGINVRAKRVKYMADERDNMAELNQSRSLASAGMPRFDSETLGELVDAPYHYERKVNTLH